MPREGCSVGIGSNPGFCYPNCYPTPAGGFASYRKHLNWLVSPSGFEPETY